MLCGIIRLEKLYVVHFYCKTYKVIKADNTPMQISKT